MRGVVTNKYGVLRRNPTNKYERNNKQDIVMRLLISSKIKLIINGYEKAIKMLLIYDKAERGMYLVNNFTQVIKTVLI